MATQENGIASNISSNLPVFVNIASSTFTNPIVVTTAAPHLLVQGDTIDLGGHQVNTNANGIWRPNVLTATTFSIPAAGNGVGAATGSVQSLALGPTFAIPSDGVDNENAASVGVAFNALADRTAFIGVSTGFYKIIQLPIFVQDNGIATPPTTWAGVAGVVANTWTATGFTGSVSGVVAGDEVRLRWSSTLGNFGGGASNGNCGVKLYVSQDVPGGPTTYVAVPGSAQFSFYTGSNPNYSPFQMLGRVAIVTTGLLRFQPYVMSSVLNTVVDLIGDYTLDVQVWRPTGMPQ